jgi:hypothetical protein
MARITTAGVTHGQELKGFQVWPTAHPIVPVPLGESFKLSLRIRPLADGSGELKLATGTPSAFKLRREKDRDIYWLDIDIGPMKEPGTRDDLIVLKTGDEASPELVVQLTTRVPAENVVLSAKAVSMTIPLASLKSGLQRPARIGIRKLVGEFRIKSVSSTLGFLKFETQAIVPGSNYLIRITLDPANLPGPGTRTGILRIETDDPQKPTVEIPCTVDLLDR